MIACFWAEHHVRRRTRAFDENWVTEAITAMFLRYLMISYGELTQCMIFIDLHVGWCKSCELWRDILQLFALWELKAGAPCSTTPPGCRICSSGGHENSIKAQSRHCTQRHCSMTFYHVLSMFVHWKTPFFLVFCRFSVVYVVSYSFTVHPRAWKQRCHRKVKASCAVWGQEIGATKPEQSVKHLMSRVITWLSTVIQDLQHFHNDVDILWTSTLNFKRIPWAKRQCFKMILKRVTK
jgi:hypothetical protein